MSNPVRQKVYVNAPDGAKSGVEASEAIAESRKTVTVTSNYTVQVNDFLIRADASSGAFTITLPTAANMKRKSVIIKKVDSSLNIVTVARSGTDQVEGATSLSLPLLNNALFMVSDGTANWYKASTV